MDDVLKAPFPWHGGKSRIADKVWERLGDVQNFVEPFAGTLAVLLRRPADHFRDGYRVETANDANGYLVNFWRAVAKDPERVAEFADWPVTEADLHARHRWLVRSREAAEFREKMASDPDHHDPKIAGWWAWGQCSWIGSGWCSGGASAPPAGQIDDLSGGFGAGTGVRSLSAKMPEISSGVGRGQTASHLSEQIPELGHPTGRGQTAAHSADVSHQKRRPQIGGRENTIGLGVNAAHPEPADGTGNHKRPHIGGHSKRLGPGVNGYGRPQLTDVYDIGRGVNGGAASLQMPLLSGPGDGVNAVAPWAGTCEARRAWLVGWMRRLSDRLRLVRTCYGHWSRVCDSDSTLTRLGLTGVFLDPPYPTHRAGGGKKSRAGGLYATDKGSDLNKLRDEVLAWCRKWGGDPLIRAAVCCYEGDGYEPLAAEGWSVLEWEATGGYGNQGRKGKGKAENAKRERILFSPHCPTPGSTRTLFDGVT